MNRWLVDTVDSDEKQMSEVGSDLCVTSGVDRVKFVNPSVGLAGDAGIKTYKDYWYAPVFNSEGSGSLNPAKFYSIVLKPVSTYISDPNSGAFMSGNLTHYSEPLSPSVASKSFIYDIPDFSDEKLVFQAGISSGGTSISLYDDTKAWTVDSWIGYQCLNVSNGLIATITSNTENALVLDSDVQPIDGDGYHIVKPKITGFEVYGIEMDAATDISVGVYSLQGYLDSDVTQYELSGFISGGVVATDLNFPPDPYYACTTANNKLIAGGGFEYSTGEFQIDKSTFSASASPSFPISITSIMTYGSIPGSSADFDHIMRVTFYDASQYLPMTKRGSIVTISGAEDALNNVSDLVCTNVADDGSWIELSFSGVINASDETAVVSVVRNVLVGNVSGINQTYLSDGMVGSSFKFNSDVDPYVISWVDEQAQEAGLTANYLGLSTGLGRVDSRPTTWVDVPFYTSASATGFADVSGSITMSFWVKFDNVDALTSSYTLIVGNASATERYRTIWNPAEVRIECASAVGSSSLFKWVNPAGGNMYVSGQWHHITFVVDAVSSNLDLYIDGVVQSNTLASGTVTGITESAANTDLTFFSEDTITSFSKVIIFNDALNAAEVQANYLDFPVSAGKIEEYICNDGSGNSCSPSVGLVSLDASTSYSWTVDYDWGLPQIVNDDGFSIYSDFGLTWSDANYPHIFRTENYTPISDRIMAIATFNQNIIMFCKNSVQAVPIAGLGQTPYLISDDVQCLAPHSVVSTPVGVFFYDGSGISMTDGQQIIPVTAYRAADYLESINNSRVINMRGVYDPQHRRIEYYFAYGSDYNNNFGITISTDSLNCYPSQRLDVNSAWLDRNDEGAQKVYHGTTNEVGEGTVWEHSTDEGTDLGIAQELVGNILSIDSANHKVTVDFGEDLDAETVISAGDVCMYLPPSDGDYFQFRLSAITDLLDPDGGQYEIDIEDSIDMSTIATGGSIIIGGIPFDYGIKWSDFSSPQYRHNVRQLHIDVTDFNGILFVEHYKDMKDFKPTYITSHYVSSDTTKVISDNRSGDCYTYGFRIYGVSMTQFEFHSFEILFETEQ